MDAAYIAQMEHILDWYAEPASLERPVVNVDEATKQLVGEVHAGTPMAPGQVSKTDYEYERKGSPISSSALTVVVAGDMPRR